MYIRGLNEMFCNLIIHASLYYYFVYLYIVGMFQ